MSSTPFFPPIRNITHLFSLSYLFDIFLGPSYNTAPPTVKYMTTNGGKFRFNPNLYAVSYSKTFSRRNWRSLYIGGESVSIPSGYLVGPWMGFRQVHPASGKLLTVRRLYENSLKYLRSWYQSNPWFYVTNLTWMNPDGLVALEQLLLMLVSEIENRICSSWTNPYIPSDSANVRRMVVHTAVRYRTATRILPY